MAQAKSKQTVLPEENNLLLTAEQPVVAADFPIEAPVNETPAAVVLILQNAGQGIVNWHCEEMAVDPVTKQRRKMRLLNNCPTIWQDEQANYTDTKWNEKNIRSIEFSNGRAVLPMHDTPAIAFFTNSGHNQSNPNYIPGKKSYFKVWNPVAEAMEDAKKEMALLEAMQYVATVDFETMKRHSVYLGIRLSNDLGMTKGEKELRLDYMRRAKADPDNFLKGVGNPLVEYNWAVKVLVTNGSIDPYSKANQAYWNDGGFITSIPEGKDVVAYLTQFATQNEPASRDFAAKLKQLAKL